MILHLLLCITPKNFFTPALLGNVQRFNTKIITPLFSTERTEKQRDTHHCGSDHCIASAYIQ
jgi:hypothetical protein